MDYIMLRAPQPPPGQSRKRFSLYLSSQLMYGVVKIYNKQHDYLLNDASTFMSRLRLATVANEDIDLKEAVSHDLVTLPDPVTMFQPETEYFDPLFGQIKENANESLMAHERLQISSASESDQTITYSPKSIDPLRIGDVLGSPNTVSSIEEITLKEMSSLISRVEPLATLEEDLLPGFGELFENLNEQETDIPIMTEAHQSPIPHSLSDVPIVPVHETPIYRPDNELAKKHKEHPTPGITPEQQEKRQKRKRASMKLVLDDIDSNIQQISLPKKRKRLIIDKETQISREAFKKNLKNSTTSQPNSIIDIKSKSMGDFFKTPGRELSRSLLYCFQRNCKLPETIFLSDTETSVTSSTLVTSPPPVSPTITAPVSISRSADIELQVDLLIP
ncbi:meiotic recombination protein REC8 homolog [Patella vulgata]|uniref:meiotic recombination protein REC8 homolog n=1 Tax=Patella vulgata TaxID=6465 RepID=UPI0024A7B713|nr:meiotic recombination protein REC8 homolog [Patella vulgata]